MLEEDAEGSTAKQLLPVASVGFLQLVNSFAQKVSINGFIGR